MGVVAILGVRAGAASPDTFRYDGGRYDRASGIAVDAAGSWYVPGYIERTDGRSSFGVIKHRAGGAVEWVGVYNGSSGGPNGTAVAAAVDPAGNVYAAGYVFNWGTSIGALDYLIVKFDVDGVQRWSIRYDGPGHNYDSAQWLALDTAGNVYVTGRSYGSSFDWATLKISAAGSVLWTQRFDTPLQGSDDDPMGLAVDGLGNVVVAGRAANASGAPGNDVKAIKYSAFGQIVWQAAFTDTPQSDDVASAMAVDASGSVVVTGQTSATASPEQPVFPFLVKFGPDGQLDFALRDAAAGGSAVAVDAQSNIYVAGTSAPAFATPYTAGSKFSADGVLQWTTPIPDTSSMSVNVYRLVVDSTGAPFLAGAAVDRNTSTRDFLTIALSAAGATRWQHRFNGAGSGNDDVAGLALDPEGNLLVSGTAWGGYVSSGGTAEDIVTLKFARGSVPASTKPAAPASLVAQALAATQVSLRWDDRSSDENGFYVERCTGNKCTAFSRIAQVPGGTTTYRDATVVKSSTYSYRVVAFNDAESSAPSSVATVQTPKK
jgi:hypothetical protein